MAVYHALGVILSKNLFRHNITYKKKPSRALEKLSLQAYEGWMFNPSFFAAS